MVLISAMLIPYTSDFEGSSKLPTKSTFKKKTMPLNDHHQSQNDHLIIYSYRLVVNHALAFYPLLHTLTWNFVIFIDISQLA